MSASTRFIIVDNTDPNIKYVGPWFPDPNSFDDNGDNGPSWNNTMQGVNTNASLAYNFTGTAVEAYGTLARRSARANGDIDPSWDCYVDGVLIRSTTLPPIGGTEHNELLCGVNSLSNGLHTILLQATVTNSTSSFWFDDFHYLPSSNVPLDNATIIVDNTDPEIEFGEGWKSAISGGVQTVESDTGLNLSFVGVQLTWFGMALANSSTALFTGASYSIDGAPPVSFLLPGALGPITQLNQIVFQTGELSPGPHRLQVTSSPNTPLTLQYLVIQNSTIPGPSTTSGSGGSLGHSIPTPQSNPSLHSNSTPKSNFPIAAVAGVVSAIIVITALAIVILILRRQRQRARKKQMLDPFHIVDVAIPPSNTTEYSGTSFPFSSVPRSLPAISRIPFMSFPIQTTGKVFRVDRNPEAAAIISAEGADTTLVHNRLGTAGEARQAASHVGLPSREERSIVDLPPLYTLG